MSRDYGKLLDNLKTRMNPEGYSDTRLFGDSINREFLSVAGNKILDYVKRSMQGVAKEYTDKSIEAGTRVRGHLDSVLDDVSFEYQGSVMTNTHIKGNSDIDLLVLNGKFYYSNNQDILEAFNAAFIKSILTNPQITRLTAHNNAGVYQGNSNQDLQYSRLRSETKLMSEYKIYDISKPKCIKITNQDLHRDVDIVIAAWHKTFEGIRDANSKRNQIRVYDKDSNTVGRVESPFVSIERINAKDREVDGRLKKMIRFTKTVKYDADYEIDLTSFDINAICYNIPTHLYFNKSYYDLVPILADEFAKLGTDSTYRDSIRSVDGSEFIFRGNPNKFRALTKLCELIIELLDDINANTYVKRF